jgi:hypothetical protein
MQTANINNNYILAIRAAVKSSLHPTVCGPAYDDGEGAHAQAHA